MSIQLTKISENTNTFFTKDNNENLDDIWNQFENIKLNENTKCDECKETKCKNKRCNSKNLVRTNTDFTIVCVDCGMVNENTYIFNGDDSNNYEDGQGVRRNLARFAINKQNDGMNPNEDQCSSFIPSSGPKFQIKNGNISYSLAHLQTRQTGNYKSKSWNDVSILITEMCGFLRLNQTIVNSAKYVWSEYVKKNIGTKLGNRRGIIIWCIYIACKINDVPRLEKEIMKEIMFHYPEYKTTDFKNGFVYIKDLFNDHTELKKYICDTIDESDLYNRFCDQLQLPIIVSKKCKELQQEYEIKLSGMAPKTQVAGIIYHVVKNIYNFKTPIKSTVAQTIGVCIPTLDKCLKKINA
jgi:transcription initiation factor TFIIIB Brf1 subunit/transcription initiation factor TFIIB